MSHLQDPDPLQEPCICDTGKPRPGYPVTLPTGQQIAWEEPGGGTQLIRLSAKGAPPFSPDHVLTLLHYLERDGLNPDTWECTSIEINKDSRKLRVDASYSLQIIEGLLLKVYQHGSSTRIEIADRRKVPLREIADLFQMFAGTLNEGIILKEVTALKDRVHRIEKNTQPRKAHRQPSSKGKTEGTRPRPAGFVTAAALKAGEYEGKPHSEIMAGGPQP